MYTTFIRTAKNFEDFANAEKEIVEEGLTAEKARELCDTFNRTRSEAEKEAGTKMEFTLSENL